MANQVDDMSADPDRGILEPERATVEPLGSPEPPARPGAPRRPAASAKSTRTQANDRPAASEPSKPGRKPVRARAARDAAAPDPGAHSASGAEAVPLSDGSSMASGTQPIGPVAARTAMVRQGLPR